MVALVDPYHHPHVYMSNLSVELFHIPIDFLAAPIPSYPFEEPLPLIAGPTSVDNSAEFSGPTTRYSKSPSALNEEFC